MCCCCRKLTRKQTRKPGVCTPHCSEKWGIGISNACFLEVLRGTMWNPKWSMGGHPCPFLLYGSKFICYLQWGSPCNDLQVRVLESGHDPHVGWLILKSRILCRMLSLHKGPRSPPFSDRFGWLSSVLLCQGARKTVDRSSPGGCRAASKHATRAFGWVKRLANVWIGFVLVKYIIYHI